MDPEYNELQSKLVEVFEQYTGQDLTYEEVSGIERFTLMLANSHNAQIHFRDIVKEFGP